MPLPAPSLTERHEINKLISWPRAYTHPVLFDANRQVGSAVLLRHGSRLFAFTAAHVIEGDPKIHFHSGAESDRTTILETLSTYIHPKYDPEPPVSKFDIGILELKPTSPGMFGNIGQLYTGEFGKPKKKKSKVKSTEFVWVVGFPSEYVDINAGGVVLKQTAFCTQILEHSSEEISLRYPDAVYRMPHASTSCEIGETARTPEGYSGGGVWAMIDPPRELFNPHRHIKLVGIQTHWSPTSRLVRCVPSKILAEAFKDFKPEL